MEKASDISVRVLYIYIRTYNIDIYTGEAIYYWRHISVGFKKMLESILVAAAADEGR